MMKKNPLFMFFTYLVNKYIVFNKSNKCFPEFSWPSYEYTKETLVWLLDVSEEVSFIFPDFPFRDSINLCCSGFKKSVGNLLAAILMSAAAVINPEFLMAFTAFFEIDSAP